MTPEQIQECGEEAYRSFMLCGRPFKTVYQEYCADNDIIVSHDDTLACLDYRNKLINDEDQRRKA